jgi:Na+-driven multidrug efflux pump
MLVMGLSTGYQPFAGYNYGAKNYARLQTGLRLTILYGTIVSVFFAIIFFLFGESIIRLFIDDAATIEAGGRMLRAFVTATPFLAIQSTMMVTFQALGKPVQAMIVTLGRQCLFFIPLIFILNHLFGFDGYIFAQPVADNATTIISALLAVSLFRTLRKKQALEV